MPSLSFSTQTALLAALFQGVPLPNPSALYMALHTSNPGGAGNQATSETAYSNYARVAIPCSPGSWSLSQNDPAQIQNIQAIAFPICGTNGDVLSFWSIGYQASGSGQIIVSGPIGTGAAYGFSCDTHGNLFLPLLPPGIVPGASVILYQFGPSMLLPQGFNEGQIYFVSTVSSELLTLSAAPNGAPILPSIPGTGLLLPATPIVVTPGVGPKFPPNSLFTFMD